jgi:glycogen debranching enzyme
MPQPHQPYLHDLITVLAAPTQMLSQRSGEIAASHDRQTVQGLLHADVRILSELAVRVNRQHGEHLATTFHDANRVQFTYVLPTVAIDVVSADPQLRLDCFRRIEAGQLNETLVINSQRPEVIEVDVDVELSCDFARLNVIKMGQLTKARPMPDVSGDHVSWVEEEIAVSLEADGADLRLSEDRCRLTLRWHVLVPAHGEVSASWRLRMDDIRGVLLPATSPIMLSDLTSAAGRVDDRLQPWLNRSLEDLRTLWMATRDAPQDGFFAAGAPWYLTLFGRDSIWAARMLLPLETEPARRTLRTLSAARASA